MSQTFETYLSNIIVMIEYYMYEFDVFSVNGAYLHVLSCVCLSMYNIFAFSINIYVYLSSTLPEIAPDTAYVVCISESLGFPYMVSVFPCFPYMVSICPYSHGNTAHCSGYGVAMGCYGLFIVTRNAIVTSQWHDRYCFTEYAWTWARHPTTPWQRECTAITDRHSIDSLLDSMRFVPHFWEIAPYILRDAIVVLVQSQCYSLNARAFGPRTPYRVRGVAGDVKRAWVSHYLVNHWIYHFKASTQYSYCMYIYIYIYIHAR